MSKFSHKNFSWFSNWFLDFYTNISDCTHLKGFTTIIHCLIDKRYHGWLSTFLKFTNSYFSTVSCIPLVVIITAYKQKSNPPEFLSNNVIPAIALPLRQRKTTLRVNQYLNPLPSKFGQPSWQYTEIADLLFPGHAMCNVMWNKMWWIKYTLTVLSFP